MRWHSWMLRLRRRYSCPWTIQSEDRKVPLISLVAYVQAWGEGTQLHQDTSLEKYLSFIIFHPWTQHNQASTNTSPIFTCAGVRSPCQTDIFRRTRLWITFSTKKLNLTAGTSLQYLTHPVQNLTMVSMVTKVTQSPSVSVHCGLDFRWSLL